MVVVTRDGAVGNLGTLSLQELHLVGCSFAPSVPVFKKIREKNK